jgi:hypothetical protein
MGDRKMNDNDTTNKSEKPELLIPVENVTLDEHVYRLARDGKSNFSLHRPLPADAFGVVAHEAVFVGSLDGHDVGDLIQLLGEKTEELKRMKSAVAKKE